MSNSISNRTSSKATVRIALSDLKSLVPALLHSKLRESRFYARASDDIVLQSDNSRKQKANAEECRLKLGSEIGTFAMAVAPKVPSGAQKARLKEL